MMKKLLLALVASTCLLSCAKDEVLVECEFFENRGGWIQDKQFYDQVGSAYLMAHGLGTHPGIHSARRGCSIFLWTDA